jgi:hypothetical protein
MLEVPFSTEWKDLAAPRAHLKKPTTPREAEFRTRCAEICLPVKDASGYYGGRFEAFTRFPRKPLIWK